jgi:predicted dehydrogenase
MSVRIGIIGLGWMGRLHAKYLQTVRGAKLVAVCDKNEQSVAENSKLYGADGFTDYKAILNRSDVDAVFIVVPQQFHYEIVQNCIAAHKHILCEKPLGLTREEIAGMRAMTRGYDKKFVVDFPERFTVSCQEAMRVIADGHIGRIDFIRGNFRFSMKNHDATHGMWVFDRKQGGGLILESSVHMWDMVRHVTGSEVVSISAVAREYSVDGNMLEDNFVAIGHLENGGICCIDMSGSLPRNAATDKRFEVMGSDGMVYIDEFRNFLTVHSERPVENNPEMYVEGMTHKDLMWHSEIEGGVKRLEQHFVDVIEQDLPATPGVEDGCRATEITWAIIESLNSRRMETVKYGK